MIPHPTGEHVDGIVEVQPCGTKTSDVRTLADWLAAAGITYVAMESTGESWKPMSHILAGRWSHSGPSMRQDRRPCRPWAGTGARCGAALAAARLSHALGCLQGRECPVTTEGACQHIRAEQ